MLDKITATILVNMKYEEQEIEGVIKLMDEIGECILTISPNCDNQEWTSFIGNLDAKFDLIKGLISTKKLENQKEDLKTIGDYLQKLGKEIADHKFGKEENK